MRASSVVKEAQHKRAGCKGEESVSPVVLRMLWGGGGGEEGLGRGKLNLS